MLTLVYAVAYNGRHRQTKQTTQKGLQNVYNNDRKHEKTYHSE